MDYWYRYRDDLWKRVRTFDGSGSADPHERAPISADQKLSSNIRRAQRMIEGYALCNDWQWFVTLTINPSYRSRSDLAGYRKDLVQFVRDIRKRSGAPVRYILVPELHRSRDGWHMHGLLQGLPETELRAFTLNEKLPAYLRSKIRSGQAVYDWTGYRQRFGWVDVEPVRNRDAASRYISKYVSKSMDSTARSIDVSDHLYYVSRGLRSPELVATTIPRSYYIDGNAPVSYPEAFPSDLIVGHSFSYDYGEVTWYERPANAGSGSPALLPNLAWISEAVNV